MIVLKSRYILVGITIIAIVIAIAMSFQLREANKGDLNHDGLVNDDDATLMFANWSDK